MVIYLQIRLPSTYGEYYIIIKHVIMSVNEHIRPSEADPGLTWGQRRGGKAPEVLVVRGLTHAVLPAPPGGLDGEITPFISRVRPQRKAVRVHRVFWDRVCFYTKIKNKTCEPRYSFDRLCQHIL